MKNLTNSVQLIGRIGNEPEMKNLEGGKSLTRFSLATNDTYKNAKGEKVNETQWHNLVAWGKTGEIITKYAHKGSEIGVHGKLTTRSWEDKDGNKRYTTEVVVDEVLLMGSKKEKE